MLRTVFVLDVAGYGMRTVPERDDVQRRLRQLVVAMLAECGLTLDMRVVDHQWTGDGINGVLPPDIDPPAVLSSLVRSLAAGLCADNGRHADRIRLRMAIGVGIIERRAAGFGGPVIVNVSRLVESAALRSALSGDPAADLVVAISDQVYTLIIQPGYPGIPAGQFTQANIVAKEFARAAWIWLSTRQWSEPAYLPLRAADPREAGGYRIVARLSSGPASAVYLASGGPGDSGPGDSGPRDSGPGDSGPGWVALKVFDRRLAADPAVRRRLSLGTIAAGVVREPHVAPVLDASVPDAGVDDKDQPWVASTLVRGPSLAAVVAETGRLPAEASGWVALGLARALATLHAAGFTHDAVSPHNVVLGAQGPVLSDFGMNKATLTAGPGNPADDVRMLGATVFFAATGRPPWVDGPAFTVPAAAVEPPAAPGDPDLTGCPAPLADVAAACLAADPAARPTAAQLHAWLAGATGQRPRHWLPDPVAARVAEYEGLPPARGRFRWPRGRGQ